MERARVERSAKDASFESLPVEVVREILVRRARDETWIFYARAFVSFSPLVLLRVARQRGTNATQCETPGLASRQLGGLNG